MYGCVAREDERADGRHGRDPSQGDAEDVHVLDEQARGRVPSADEVGLGKPVVHEEGSALARKLEPGAERALGCRSERPRHTRAVV